MDVFAAAKRQYRLQLRPDEVLAEARWPTAPPEIEEVNAALTQLTAWGNLESHPDTAPVSSLSDFYRARYLYRLSQGGEAVESALTLFVQTLERRAELQSVALEDIASRLEALRTLATQTEPDVAKVHETLRDLIRVFEGLAENAQAFMAGVARSIELQQAQAGAVVNYKRQLIDYLERDDPDAPAGTWHHWAAYDIPTILTELAEGAARNKNMKQAVNDFRKVGYGGPCPPPGHGPHHCHFRLLALSTDQLQAKANASCREIEREARKSLIGEAILVGWYER
jgi:Raf kinase inhibitor-like YbhB/YbcL family protein